MRKRDHIWFIAAILVWGVAALLLLGGVAFGAPPTLTIPAEVVPAGDYATVTPATDGVSVTYVGLSGVDPFPSGLLRDQTTFVLPVRGLPAGVYRFAGIAAGKAGEQSRTDFAVRVGEKPALPLPPVKPPDPPAPPSEHLYLLAVRPNGPAAPAFTQVMGLGAWDTLRTRGHTVKDLPFVDACRSGWCPPAGTQLPCVYVLLVSADAKTAKLVRGPLALPTTEPGILALVDATP